MSGMTFEKHSRYCMLRFTPEVTKMPWEDVKAATSRVAEMVHSSPTNSVLVDLSQMESVPSGLVASLVQTWRGMDENRRQFVVVSSHENVTTELEQTGLAGLWTITGDLQTAYSNLGVVDNTDLEMDSVPTSTSIPVSNIPIEFAEHKRYCSLVFNPILMSQDWEAVERTTTESISRIETAESDCLLVDLSRMTIINSALVATLVRAWKAVQGRGGHFSVVSPDENVTDVLRTSGLAKLWNIAESREDAIYELGVSNTARSEERERRVLSMVAVPCAIIAVLATSLMLLQRTQVMGVNAQLTALLFGAAALATGSISVMKESGIRRRISAGAVVVSLLVLSTLWFKENPISFGKPLPDRNFNREDDDDDAVLPNDTDNEMPSEEMGSEEETGEPGLQKTGEATTQETVSNDDRLQEPAKTPRAGHSTINGQSKRNQETQ